MRKFQFARLIAFVFRGLFAFAQTLFRLLTFAFLRFVAFTRLETFVFNFTFTFFRFHAFELGRLFLVRRSILIFCKKINQNHNEQYDEYNGDGDTSTIACIESSIIKLAV